MLLSHNFFLKILIVCFAGLYDSFVSFCSTYIDREKQITLNQLTERSKQRYERILPQYYEC